MCFYLVDVMEQMTFHIPDSVVEHIEGKAEEDDVSKSKVVRELLQRGIEYPKLESECDQLRKQLQATNSRNEVDDKLVKYVENDIDYHEAGLATKLRWFVFGKS